MTKALILKMRGGMKETSISTLTKIVLPNKGTPGFAHELGSWTYNNDTVKIYGWEEGKAGKENKHEIPPPCDTALFFGDLLIVRLKKDKLINFTKKDYHLFFEEMYGGFEDIGDTDSEYSTDTDVSNDSDY